MAISCQHLAITSNVAGYHEQWLRPAIHMTDTPYSTKTNNGQA
jgi:hypothetical protein